jgi:DNA end-binding protein Ku
MPGRALSGLDIDREDPLHLINKEIGNRLNQQMIDAEIGDVVEGEQKARGYELKKGEYVEVEKEELEAVQIESNHAIDIDSFVPKVEIDKRYLNHPYYIAPDGKAGIDAFAVICDAMKDQDRVALARIAGPESIAPDRAYGFQARSFYSRPD